jgi:hypothetical protein
MRPFDQSAPVVNDDLPSGGPDQTFGFQQACRGPVSLLPVFLASIQMQHGLLDDASRSFSADEFVEPAYPILGSVLVKKGQLVFIENGEEFVPGDLFQLLFRLSEVYPQYATLAGAFDTGRLSLARFHPFANC